MARKLRVQFPGAVYHVSNRGDRRKGDSQKAKMARRRPQETTMTLRWIAQRLNMGAAVSLANLLRNTK